jgi:hypothetical protein
MNGEIFVHTPEARNKVIFEYAYGALSSIVPMHSWGYELEVGVVGMHKFFEQGGAFIVESLETRLSTSGA